MAMEFWFEFASTYSYPAALRIEALARSQGVPVVWKPFKNWGRITVFANISQNCDLPPVCY